MFERPAKAIASKLTNTKNHVPTHIEFVKIVHGSSGSGKSFYIHSEAERVGSDFYHVPINEEFKNPFEIRDSYNELKMLNKKVQNLKSK